MRSALLLVVTLGASYAVARGQAPAAPSPAFDVAAIKQNKSGETGGRLGGPPSRFTATNVPVRQFIVYAYDVRDFQIEGGPDWIRTDRFDVNARAEGNFPITATGPDVRRAMVRALLEDRFRLAVHRTTREMPIYALVTAKADKSPGPLMHPSTTDCAALISAAARGQAPPSPPLTPDGTRDCAIALLSGRLEAGTQPLTQFAATLSQLLQRVVVDRTGLSGTYSAKLTWTPDPVPQSGGPDLPASDPNGPSLFTAIQEQLGLKLESTRGPVDVLVIDHVERPTED